MDDSDHVDSHLVLGNVQQSVAAQTAILKFITEKVDVKTGSATLTSGDLRIILRLVDLTVAMQRGILKELLHEQHHAEIGL